MYKTIIINTTEKINESLLDNIDYIIVSNIELLTTYKLKINNEICEFDYLITDSKISNTILTEDGFIITNENFETNVDNYFAIGKKVRTTKSIDEQLSIILECIKGSDY